MQESTLSMTLGLNIQLVHCAPRYIPAWRELSGLIGRRYVYNIGLERQDGVVVAERPFAIDKVLQLTGSLPEKGGYVSWSKVCQAVGGFLSQDERARFCEQLVRNRWA